MSQVSVRRERQAGLGPRAQREAKAERRWEGGPAERSVAGGGAASAPPEGKHQRLLLPEPRLPASAARHQEPPAHTSRRSEAAASLVVAHQLSNLADRLLLQLADTLAGEVVLVTDLFEGELILVVEAEAPADNA